MKRPILIFIFISFFLNWALTLTGVFGVIFYGFSKGPIYKFLFYFSYAIGASAIAIAAIICISILYKNPGLLSLRQKLKPIRFPTNIFLITISPLFFWVIGLLFFRIIKGIWFDFSTIFNEDFDTVLGIVAWGSPIACYAIFGEIGLRGFTLPYIQEKFSAFKASILVAFIWMMCLTPFWMMFRSQFSTPVYFEILTCILMGSIILTYLYSTSEGMLAAGILFHFTLNLAFVISPGISRFVLSLGLFILAGAIFWKYGKENLSKKSRYRNYFLENSSFTFK